MGSCLVMEISVAAHSHTNSEVQVHGRISPCKQKFTITLLITSKTSSQLEDSQRWQHSYRGNILYAVCLQTPQVEIEFQQHTCRYFVTLPP